MRGLYPEQRNFLAKSLEKVYLMILGGLVITRFVPGQHIDWQVMLLGIITFITLLLYAVRLKNPTK